VTEHRHYVDVIASQAVGILSSALSEPIHSSSAQ